MWYSWQDGLPCPIQLDYVVHNVSDLVHSPSSTARGRSQAAEELLPIIYGELRMLAAAKMAAQPAGQTIQATALVHEA